MDKVTEAFEAYIKRLFPDTFENLLKKLKCGAYVYKSIELREEGFVAGYNAKYSEPSNTPHDFESILAEKERVIKNLKYEMSEMESHIEELMNRIRDHDGY